jgi:hypothetical protein
VPYKRKAETFRTGSSGSDSLPTRSTTYMATAIPTAAPVATAGRDVRPTASTPSPANAIASGQTSANPAASAPVSTDAPTMVPAMHVIAHVTARTTALTIAAASSAPATRTRRDSGRVRRTSRWPSSSAPAVAPTTHRTVRTISASGTIRLSISALT